MAVEAGARLVKDMNNTAGHIVTLVLKGGMHKHKHTDWDGKLLGGTRLITDSSPPLRKCYLCDSSNKSFFIQSSEYLHAM